MSHSSSRLRGLGLAGLATLASLAAAPSAGATAYTVNAQCDLPVIGSRSVSIGIDVPATAAPGAAVVPFTVTSLSGPALQPILEEADATVKLTTSVALPSGGAAPAEALAVHPLRSPVDASAINLVGESGQATVVYTGVSMGWRSRTPDASGNFSTMPIPCSLPVGNLNYPKIQIGDEANLPPSPPGPLSVARTSATTIKVTWGASTGNVARYNVYVDGAPVATVAAPNTSATVTGIVPGPPVEIGVAAVGTNGLSTRPTTVTFTEVIIDRFGIPANVRIAPTPPVSPTSVSLIWDVQGGLEPPSFDVFQDGVKVKSVSTRAATITGLTPGKPYVFTVSAGGETVTSNPLTVTLPPLPSSSYAWDLKGSATIKTLIKGSVPLKGGLAVDIDDAGAVTGDLVLQEASARLTALSFLPLTAKIAFVASGRTTGTYAADVLKTTSKMRIKVTQAKLFGAIPVVTGNTCQTRKLSDINLTSGAGFSLQEGGSLSGQFALSDLNGCGSLNGLISPLTSGTGNTITLQATPPVPPMPQAS